MSGVRQTNFCMHQVQFIGVLCLCRQLRNVGRWDVGKGSGTCGLREAWKGSGACGLREACCTLC